MSATTSTSKRFDQLMKRLDYDVYATFFIDPDNVIFITKDDAVYCFGKNTNGCLGCGSDLPIEEKPRMIYQLARAKINQIEYGGQEGNRSVFAISASGSVYAWGCNDSGQLGLGSKDLKVVTPQRILESVGSVKQVACGFHHTLALTELGQVYAFGSNENGALGLGHYKNVSWPTKVDLLVCERRVKSIACGLFTSLALNDIGEVFAWGGNEDSTLVPIYRDMNSCIPCKVMGMETATIVKILCGSHHALALSSDGRIFAWGRNDYGQLGIGESDADHIAIPNIIPSNRFGRIEDIAVAKNFSLDTCAALNKKREIYAWGNIFGEMASSPQLTSPVHLNEIFQLDPFQKLTPRFSLANSLERAFVVAGSFY